MRLLKNLNLIRYETKDICFIGKMCYYSYTCVEYYLAYETRSVFSVIIQRTKEHLKREEREVGLRHSRLQIEFTPTVFKLDGETQSPE